MKSVFTVKSFAVPMILISILHVVRENNNEFCRAEQKTKLAS